MSDIKHENFRHDTRITAKSRAALSQLKFDRRVLGSAKRGPYKRHASRTNTTTYKVSGGQGGESGRIVQMNHIDSTLDWRTPPFSLSLHQWQKVRLSLFKGYASVELREQEWCHKFAPGTRPSLFAPLELLSGFKEQQIKKRGKKETKLR